MITKSYSWSLGFPRRSSATPGTIPNKSLDSFGPSIPIHFPGDPLANPRRKNCVLPTRPLATPACPASPILVHSVNGVHGVHGPSSPCLSASVVNKTPLLGSRTIRDLPLFSTLFHHSFVGGGGDLHTAPIILHSELLTLP